MSDPKNPEDAEPGEWQKAIRFYWRLSAIRCTGPGLFDNPPLAERVRFTLRWWLRERRRA